MLLLNISSGKFHQWVFCWQKMFFYRSVVRVSSEFEHSLESTSQQATKHCSVFFEPCSIHAFHREVCILGLYLHRNTKVFFNNITHTLGTMFTVSMVNFWKRFYEPTNKKRPYQTWFHTHRISSSWKGKQTSTIPIFQLLTQRLWKLVSTILYIQQIQQARKTQNVCYL